MKILETSRLILREFSAADVDALSEILCDAETMRYYPKPFDRAAVEEWIEGNRRRYAKDGHGLWAMALKSNEKLVGDCGLTLQEVDEAQEVEIGYHVRHDLWGQGLATEAAQSCRDYGFANLQATRLISLIRRENIQSRRVAEKNNMSMWKETVYTGIPHLVYAVRREQVKKK
jgi:[ribosomal protein S5]-alanine N-acetyltransferase